MRPWEIMKAYEEGATIERLIKDRPSDGWSVVENTMWNWAYCEYRVKPAKKLRPWRPEEVPVGAVARRLSDANDRFMILASNKNGIDISCHNDRLSFACVYNVFEHSADNGKTWKPCGIEE